MPIVDNIRCYKSAAKSCTAGLQTSVVVFVGLLFVLPLRAQTNSQYLLCFPPVVGLPVLTSPPPTDPCGRTLVAGAPPFIEGCVSGDPGWTGAFRYVIANGTSFPKVAVQGIKDNMFLYLSIEADKNSDNDPDDVVVLVLSPSDGSSPTDDRRII